MKPVTLELIPADVVIKIDEPRFMFMAGTRRDKNKKKIKNIHSICELWSAIKQAREIHISFHQGFILMMSYLHEHHTRPYAKMTRWIDHKDMMDPMLKELHKDQDHREYIFELIQDQFNRFEIEKQLKGSK